MKHLRKKYIRSSVVGQDVVDIINSSSIDEDVINELKQNEFEGYYGIVQTEGKELIQTFQYKENNRLYFIPEPDPIVIYFDTGRHFQKSIAKTRISLFSELNKTQSNAHQIANHFHYYFANCSGLVIFIFLALEALINKIIPSDFEYRKDIQNKKIELYNKSQIQRNIDFLEKIKIVLPQAVNLNFHQNFPDKYDTIRELKEFRDEIVHTKSQEGASIPNYYQNLYNKALEFNFEKSLLAAKYFINYYHHDLIEECDCGNED